MTNLLRVDARQGRRASRRRSATARGRWRTCRFRRLRGVRLRLHRKITDAARCSLRSSRILLIGIVCASAAALPRQPPRRATRGSSRRSRPATVGRGAGAAAAQARRSQRRRSRTAPRRCTGPCATTTRRWWIGCSRPAPTPRPRTATASRRLPLACESGGAAVVERLLKAGVSAERHRPARRDGAPHLRAHGQRRPRPRCCSRTARRSNAGDSWRGQTPLMWAAAQGHADDDARC